VGVPAYNLVLFWSRSHGGLRFLSRALFPFILLAVFAPRAYPECIPYFEAPKHIGAIKGVTGKVLRVKQGKGGVHFLISARTTGGVHLQLSYFPRDLHRIGDVRRLRGRQIEIDGDVKGYDGRAGGDHSSGGGPVERGCGEDSSAA
jgi:hypothetical protein